MNSIIWCRVGFLVAQRYFLKNGQNWPILTPPGGTPLGGSKMAFFQGASPYSCIKLEGEPKFDVSLIRGGTPGEGVPPGGVFLTSPGGRPRPAGPAQLADPPIPPHHIVITLCDEKTHPYAFIEILETD